MQVQYRVRFNLSFYKWQPTEVFLSGQFHAQRSLVGYSLRGCTESDV